MMTLHDMIMNITTTREAEHEECSNRREAYLHGHRDAIHKAAEIAQKADAEIERLRSELSLSNDEIVGLLGELSA